MERYVVYAHFMRCGYYVKRSGSRTVSRLSFGASASFCEAPRCDEASLIRPRGPPLSCLRHPAVWKLQDDKTKESPALALTSPAWEYPWLPTGTQEPQNEGLGAAPEADGTDAAREEEERTEATVREKIVEEAKERETAKGREEAKGREGPNEEAEAGVEVSIAGQKEEATEVEVDDVEENEVPPVGQGGAFGDQEAAPEPPAAPLTTRDCGARWWSGLGESHPWLPISEEELAALLPP
jgi:hypothetical protein